MRGYDQWLDRPIELQYAAEERAAEDAAATGEDEEPPAAYPVTGLDPTGPVLVDAAVVEWLLEGEDDEERWTPEEWGFEPDPVQTQEERDAVSLRFEGGFE